MSSTSPFRRIVWAVRDRDALHAAYRPEGLCGSFVLPKSLQVSAGESVELEVVIVEEIMVFHIRGLVDDAGPNTLLRIAPFDRSARDVILGFARRDGATNVQRRKRRFPLRVAIDLTDHTDFVKMMTQDVSDRGAFIESTSPPPLGALIAMRIPVPDGEPPLLMRAEVVWRTDKPRPGFGVHFLTADTAATTRMARWLAGMGNNRDG